MIKVFIRLLDEEEGRCLGEFKPSEINDVVKLVQEHGSTIDTGEDLHTTKYFDSQFVMSDDKQFFEIIVEEQ